MLKILNSAQLTCVCRVPYSTKIFSYCIVLYKHMSYLVPSGLLTTSNKHTYSTMEIIIKDVGLERINLVKMNPTIDLGLDASIA